MLEWLVKIVKALMKGGFKGGITVYIKKGNISAITMSKYDHVMGMHEEIDLTKLNK